MELVQPIRDVKKIAAMKKYLLGGPYGTRNHLLFTLGINSALRISDLLSFKVSDVLTTKGEIKPRIVLREKKSARKATDSARAKSGKLKDFPLGDSSIAAIRLHLATLDTSDRRQPLFASKKGGEAITRQHAWTILSDAAEAVGIGENVGTHTLRKTFGYHAYQDGVPIETLAAIFNHGSTRETLRYIGITRDKLDKVYVKLNL
jgi:site-specific recombinase XerD